MPESSTCQSRSFSIKIDCSLQGKMALLLLDIPFQEAKLLPWDLPLFAHMWHWEKEAFSHVFYKFTLYNQTTDKFTLEHNYPKMTPMFLQWSDFPFTHLVTNAESLQWYKGTFFRAYYSFWLDKNYYQAVPFKTICLSKWSILTIIHFQRPLRNTFYDSFLVHNQV